MASSDPPSNEKDDEQVPIGFPPERGSKPDNSPSPSTESKLDMRNGETAKSTPPSTEKNTDAANKRKREPVDGDINDKEENISGKDTQAIDTTNTRETRVATVDTTTVKEVEMKDAEAVDGSLDQCIKEIEMQDAEVVNNETHVKETSREDANINKDDTVSNLKATEDCKQDQVTKETENQQMLMNPKAMINKLLM